MQIRRRRLARLGGGGIGQSPLASSSVTPPKNDSTPSGTRKDAQGGSITENPLPQVTMTEPNASPATLYMETVSPASNAALYGRYYNSQKNSKL